MSVIQRIRDKGALISVIVIAISLLGFILMDAFAGKGSIFNSQSRTVGSVNGQDIEYNEFAAQVAAVEQQYSQSNSPYTPTNDQIVAQVWEGEVSRAVLKDELEKLGIEISSKELTNMLYLNPPPQLRQQLTDESGQYNPAQLQRTIAEAKKSKNQQFVSQINNEIASIELSRAAEKYTSLLTNSIHFPKWYIEQQNNDNSLIANVNYVQVPYSTVPDSSVSVSNDEIESYVNKHADQFKQEATRSISYVLFSALPSAADSAAVKEQVAKQKEEFANAKDNTLFLRSVGSQIDYDSNMYHTKEAIQQPNEDSILSQPVGVVYGPYLDGGSWALSKIVAVRRQPDSVTVRHILVSTAQRNPQNQQQLIPVRPDSMASRMIDSIQTAIKGGASFDTLLAKYSDDGGSKDNGGKYENVPSGQMMPSFDNFIFSNPVGTKGIVKTPYGYHYVEILSSKGNSTAYNVAYLSVPIVASDETDNQARNAATQFAGNARNQKEFDDYFEKNLKPKQYNKGIADNIDENAAYVPGIGNSRSFVRDLYEADKGDVLDPIRVDDNYVVAIVNGVYKKGVQSAAQARPMVEPILRDQKKAEKIKQTIGTISSLNDVASKTNQQLQTVDSLRLDGQSQISFEPFVVGAAFNPANKGQLVKEPIAGRSGVFALQVNSVDATSVGAADIAVQRAQLTARARQMMGIGGQYGQGYDPTAVLREAASIKDNRAKFY